MQREVGSAPYELPHEFELERAADGRGHCKICRRPEGDLLHHAERVTETAADTGPAVITEKGS